MLTITCLDQKTRAWNLRRSAKYIRCSETRNSYSDHIKPLATLALQIGTPPSRSIDSNLEGESLRSSWFACQLAGATPLCMRCANDTARRQRTRNTVQTRAGQGCHPRPGNGSLTDRRSWSTTIQPALPDWMNSLRGGDMALVHNRSETRFVVSKPRQIGQTQSPATSSMDVP